MIPKIIYYCWFGKGEKTRIIQECLKSWSQYCPEYEIKEWNEDNWNVDEYPFAKKAYISKKWAFVSDVARLDILYRFGGIYLDTDVLLLKYDPFSEYLQREAFFAFENERNINTGMCCGFEPNSALAKELLQTYYNKEYVDGDRRVINTAMNHDVFSSYLNLKWNDEHQIIGNIEIMTIGEFNIIARHFGTRTWDDSQLNLSGENRIYKDTKVKRKMRNPKIFYNIEKFFGKGKFLNIYTFLAYDLLEAGPMYFIKRWINKFHNH